MAIAKMRPFGTLAVAASAAAVPIGTSVQAADLPVKAVPLTPAWAPHWTFSAEGGLLISDFSRTAFPSGINPTLLPSDVTTGTVDKAGFFTTDETTASGSLAPRRNIGWYGALSIGRDIDPVWDWRLSGSFNSFDTNRRSAAVNETGFFECLGECVTSDATRSRVVTEADRFRFFTADFDVGRQW